MSYSNDSKAQMMRQLRKHNREHRQKRFKLAFTAEELEILRIALCYYQVSLNDNIIPEERNQINPMLYKIDDILDKKSYRREK